MLAWAQSMTWQLLHPVIELNQSVYQKGVSLTKVEMQDVEGRLERNPALPKWDILLFDLLSRYLIFRKLLNCVNSELRFSTRELALGVVLRASSTAAISPKNLSES